MVVGGGGGVLLVMVMVIGSWLVGRGLLCTETATATSKKIVSLSLSLEYLEKQGALQRWVHVTMCVLELELEQVLSWIEIRRHGGLLR